MYNTDFEKRLRKTRSWLFGLNGAILGGSDLLDYAEGISLGYVPPDELLIYSCKKDPENGEWIPDHSIPPTIRRDGKKISCVRDPETNEWVAPPENLH